MLQIYKFPKSEPYPFKLFLLFISVFALYFLISIKLSFNFTFVFLIIIAVGSVLGLYFLREPALGVALMIVATSLDVVGRITPQSSIPITFFHFFFILSLFAFILKKLHSTDFKIKMTNIDNLILLFLGWIGFSLLYSPNRLEGFVFWLRIIALVLVMYLTRNVIDSKRALIIIIFCTVLSSIALSLYGAFQLLTTSSVTITNALSVYKLFSRFGATFENPNYFATFLLFPLMLLGSFLLETELRFPFKFLSLISSIGIMLIAFIGTFSRSAWAALFFGIFFLLWFSKYRRKLGIIILFSTLLVFTIFSQTAILKSFLLRFSSIFQSTSDPSSLTRLFLIQGGITMGFESYLLGVGFRGFPVIYRAMYMPPSQSLSTVFECHTALVEIFAELGIIGLSLFIFIFIRYFSSSLKTIKITNDSFLKSCQIGFVCFMFTMTINYLFSGGILDENIIWIVLGLTYATNDLSKASGKLLNQL